MQDFTNYNQPQSNDTNGYYQDSIDTTPAAPAVEEKPIEAEKAPAPNQEFSQNNEASTTSGPATTPSELAPELANYLNTTKQLLESSRKERNDLIIRMDKEEDSITIKRRGPEFDPDLAYDELDKIRDSLYRKNRLIDALIGIIRTLDQD